MSILLSAEQAEFQRSVRELLQAKYSEDKLRGLAASADGLDGELWAAFTSLELPALGVPEEAGGAGGTWVELGLVLEEMGAALVCSPFFATALAAQALTLTGGARGADWMASIRDGELTATLALPLATDGGGDLPVPLSASRSGDSWQVSGVEPRVIDGHTAGLVFAMAVTADGGRLFAIEREQAGVRARPLPVLDPTRKLAEVTFTGAVATPLSDAAGWPGLPGIADLAAVALAAEQVGGAQRCLATAVDYAKGRYQHGQAIGSFQAVKHRCADVFLRIEAARLAVYHALSCATTRRADLVLAAGVAKAAASEAFTSAAAASIQIHGAIGVTQEHPAHLYLRRAKSSEAMFGTAGEHRARLGQHIAGVPSAVVPQETILPADLEESTAAYREQVRGFLRTHLPLDWEGAEALPEGERSQWLAAWRATLAANGMLGAAWPREFGGGGRTPAEHAVILEEFARAAVPTGFAADALSMNLLAPTILAIGTEEQKRRLVPRIISGEDRWCQGYSEPEAGSDLANVKTFAVLRDGRWVINGQKIWTTSAHEANWMFALVRTDRSVPKHAGLTFMLIPMNQPGVEVRPILDINGRHHINEVFLTDALTDEANVLGSANGGWKVATALLGYERTDGALRDALNLRDELRRLVELARDRGATADPAIRSRLAQAFIDVRVILYGAIRGLLSAVHGNPPGPESSMHKLLWSEHHQRVTELALEVLGADALTPEGRPSANHVNTDAINAPSSSLSWVQTYFTARAGTIYAGTSEIQRNILAERVLGLPRGPKPSPADARG